jgi:hypothetical protein
MGGGDSENGAEIRRSTGCMSNCPRTILAVSAMKGWPVSGIQQGFQGKIGGKGESSDGIHSYANPDQLNVTEMSYTKVVMTAVMLVEIWRCRTGRIDVALLDMEMDIN